MVIPTYMIGKVAGKPDILVQKPWFPVKILPTNRSTEDRFEAPQDPTVWRGQKVAEGDVGLPGGIQILEPANLYPTYEDSIHRSLTKNRFWHFFRSSGLAGRCLLQLLKMQKLCGYPWWLFGSGHGTWLGPLATLVRKLEPTSPHLHSPRTPWQFVADPLRIHSS